MNKTELEPQKPLRQAKKVIKRGLAGAALSVTAALAPAIATAQAETAGNQKLHSYVPERVLQKESNKRIWAQQPSALYNGMLLIKTSSSTGGTAYSPEQAGGASYQSNSADRYEAIIRPLVIFRGTPKDEFGHNSITNGDFAFGSLTDRTTGRPQVELQTFNSKTMKLVPWASMGDPSVVSVVFQSDKLGNIQLDEPMTSLSPGGTPLVDASGEPWQIGLEASPKG